MAGAPPQIGMIWAQARDGIIGADGSMPWHLPEDLRHFQRTTLGHPVVMGRRTWESFPARFRPLPGRTNIVITRDDGYPLEGALRARDLGEALRLAADSIAAGSATDAAPADSLSASPAPPAPTLWVIGGGSVYAEAMDRADLLVVTEIDLEVDGDTHAPRIPADFSLVVDPSDDPLADEADSTWRTSASGLRFRILTYRRGHDAGRGHDGM